jgi:hypothetical protein
MLLSLCPENHEADGVSGTKARLRFSSRQEIYFSAKAVHNEVGDGRLGKHRPTDSNNHPHKDVGRDQALFRGVGGSKPERGNGIAEATFGTSGCN